jgi:hypothetical protein
LDGAVAGRVAAPASGAGLASVQRVGSKIYYAGNDDAASYNTIDVSTWTVGNSFTFNNTANIGYGIPIRVQPAKLLRINPVDDIIQTFDLSLSVSGTTTYNGGTDSGVLYHQSACSFYNRTAAGLTSFNSLVLWGAAFNNASQAGEIWRATYNSSSDTLGSKTTVLSNEWSYLRAQAGTASNVLGYMIRFDHLYRATPTSPYMTAVTVPTLTYNGNAYTFSIEGMIGVTAAVLPSGKIVGTFYFFDGVKTKFILGMISAATGTTATVSFVCELEDAYNVGSGTYTSLAIIPVNESGYFAVGYLESAFGGYTAALKVFDATGTLVTSAQGIPLGATYCGSNDVSFGPMLNCEWEVLLAGSATS